MRLLEELMSYATFTVIVIVAVMFFTGVPKTKARYRSLAIVLAALSLLATAQWYLHYVIAQYYFRDQPHWLLVLFCCLFGLAAVLFGIESFKPRCFLGRKKEPNPKSSAAPLRAAELVGLGEKLHIYRYENLRGMLSLGVSACRWGRIYATLDTNAGRSSYAPQRRRSAPDY